MKRFTFKVGQKVVFTEKAKSSVFVETSDEKKHKVIKVEAVPHGYEVSPEYRGFSGLIGHYAGKQSRDIVGHHQWVTLENGGHYSGAYLCPAQSGVSSFFQNIYRKCLKVKQHFIIKLTSRLHASNSLREVLFLY